MFIQLIFLRNYINLIQFKKWTNIFFFFPIVKTSVQLEQESIEYGWRTSLKINDLIKFHTQLILFNQLISMIETSFLFYCFDQNSSFNWINRMTINKDSLNVLVDKWCLFSSLTLKIGFSLIFRRINLFNFIEIS